MLPVDCPSEIFEKIVNNFVRNYLEKTYSTFLLFNNKTHNIKLLSDFTDNDIDSLVCRVVSIEHDSFFASRTMTAVFIDKHLYYDGISIKEID